MKIGISSDGENLDSFLDLRFGRCRYFVIYDTESNEVKVVENGGQSSKGGAGIAAAQQLIDENVDVVITGNLGPNAFELIEKANIKVFKSESILLKSVIEKYKNGELEELKNSGPAHHGM